MPVDFAVDPNIVYLILLFGLWSGVTAAYIPGTGVVELISAGASLAAIVILASMPTNWLALLILVVGVAGFLVMPFVNRRFALLAVGGLLLQAVGSFFLFEGISVSLPLIAATIALSLLYHRFVLLPILERHQTLPAWSDDDALIGARGRVMTALNPSGTVQAGGELWSARSNEPLDSGDEVEVVRREGLVLVVEPLKRKRDTHITQYDSEPEEFES
jgi:membrane-bound serine protease (ClpP class)